MQQWICKIILITCGLAISASMIQAEAKTPPSTENSKVSIEKNKKEPPPPASTMDFQDWVSRSSLYLSIVFSHQPDSDFATLAITQHKSLVALAEIELNHGTDPNMKKFARQLKVSAEGQIEKLQKLKAALKAKK